MRSLRPITIFVVALSLACCGKTKVDSWEGPAGSDEKFSSGFLEQAGKLYKALEQARQTLATSESEFDQLQSELQQLRQQTQKAIVTRVDRDLDFLLEGYAGKLWMLRSYDKLRDGANYLPALRTQLDGCKSQLDTLFATHPIQHPIPATGPLGPCLAPVPRSR